MARIPKDLCRILHICGLYRAILQTLALAIHSIFWLLCAHPLSLAHNMIPSVELVDSYRFALGVLLNLRNLRENIRQILLEDLSLFWLKKETEIIALPR